MINGPHLWEAKGNTPVFFGYLTFNKRPSISGHHSEDVPQAPPLNPGYPKDWQDFQHQNLPWAIFNRNKYHLPNPSFLKVCACTGWNCRLYWVFFHELGQDVRHSYRLRLSAKIPRNSRGGKLSGCQSNRNFLGKLLLKNKMTSDDKKHLK